MIPSPILKALSTIRTRQVDHLLMGGQACVLYGAAEFSRDLDLALLPDPANLDRLRQAFDDLEAEVIAVPPFQHEHLDEGLAVHFRCAAPDAAGLRIDVMTRMRGVDSFPELWQRRTTFEFGAESVDVLSLPDLIAAKKTQRDKDWPMIRRLVDVHYTTFREQPTAERVDFWLRELRTPEFLVEAATAHAGALGTLVRDRSLLGSATHEDLESGSLARALRAEEDAERSADAAYWQPLRQRLSHLRQEARKPAKG
ncbi:MAG: hypothetical protein GY719_41000 [bacterium]|nr:hypothetical protein [bacterium]